MTLIVTFAVLLATEQLFIPENLFFITSCFVIHQD